MYTITAFPLARLAEGTQEEKGRVGPLATIGELQAFSTFAEVVNAAASGTVSFHQFSHSEKCTTPNQVHRLRANFVSTNLLGLDIDGGMTIEEATAKLRQSRLKFGIYTSFNHSSGVQKFRIVVETSEPITNEASFRATWESLKLLFPNIDPSCKDTARLFYHSNPNTKKVIIEEEGGLVPVVREAPQTASIRKPSSTPNIDNEGFETASARNKLTIEVRNWLAGIDEYGEPWHLSPGERSSTFYRLANVCRERSYSKEWIDDNLGKRLRKDKDYVQRYGGINGVNDKIAATLDQVFAKNMRHDQPELYSLSDIYEPRSFLRSWMGARGASVRKNGELVYADGGTAQTPERALNTIMLDYTSARAAWLVKQASLSKDERTRIPKHSDKHLWAALDEYIEKHKAQHLVKLREKLIHKPDSLNSGSEIKKFSRAICGKEDPVAEAVLEHFLWQVKRKIFGHEVRYHLMPILSGKQGNGKSTAVKKLFGPLIDFVATPTLADLTDKRHFQSFNYNFIAFCDEMQDADRAGVEGLKNFITADRQTTRLLYSNTMAEFQQNCTPIGCTNKSLATLIYDPTGMRRFFEIITDPEMKDSGGWGLLDTVDFENLWRQIDENVPADRCPYLSMEAEIKAAQEQLRTPDPVETFIEETGATVTDPSNVTLAPAGNVYTAYRTHCNRGGHKVMNMSWFGRAMADRGFEKRRQTVDGKLQYVFVLSKGYHALSDC